MTVTVSAILATHDRPTALTRAVESLLAQTHPPHEIIVVSDGQTPPPPDLAHRARDAAVAMRTHTMPRPCLPASRNAGMRMATGEILLLIDDDHELPPDYLARLVALYMRDTTGRVHVIGGNVIEPAPPRQQWLWHAIMSACAHLRWRPRRVLARYVRLDPSLRARLRPTAVLTGGTVSIRRRRARDVSFNENLPGYALGEDRDFAYRATQRLAVFTAPELRMRHHHDRSHRADPAALGRMIVDHYTRIAAEALEPGAGKWILLAWNIAGLLLAHALYAVVGDRRRHWAVLKGMAAAMKRLAITKAGLRTCES